MMSMMNDYLLLLCKVISPKSVALPSVTITPSFSKFLKGGCATITNLYVPGFTSLILKAPLEISALTVSVIEIAITPVADAFGVTLPLIEPPLITLNANKPNDAAMPNAAIFNFVAFIKIKFSC
jgi:hypothetical protein